MSHSTAIQAFTSSETMTPREANQMLTIELIQLCRELNSIGVDEETIRLRLPGGAQSPDDLDADQTKEAIKIFTHWLDSYREVVKESVTNG